MIRAEVEGEVVLEMELACAVFFCEGPAPGGGASAGETVVAVSVCAAFFLRTMAGRGEMREWPRELL